MVKGFYLIDFGIYREGYICAYKRFRGWEGFKIEPEVLNMRYKPNLPRWW